MTDKSIFLLASLYCKKKSSKSEHRMYQDPNYKTGVEVSEI